MSGPGQAGWNSYYAQTQTLPPPERLAGFLRFIPKGGRILDFGTGSGRFALAFLRDRPDITVDVLDARLSQSWQGGEYPENIGARMELRFEDWRAEPHHYDAVWAHAALFFAAPVNQTAVFEQIGIALKAGGVFAFTHVEDGAAAESLRFHGIGEKALKAMLDAHGFTVERFTLLTDRKYGPQQVMVPTFFVYARRR